MFPYSILVTFPPPFISSLLADVLSPRLRSQATKANGQTLTTLVKTFINKVLIKPDLQTQVNISILKGHSIGLGSLSDSQTRCCKEKPGLQPNIGFTLFFNVLLSRVVFFNLFQVEEPLKNF